MKNSKKLATLAILFALVGCGGGADKKSDAPSSSTPVVSTGGAVSTGGNQSTGGTQNSSSSAVNEDQLFVEEAARKLIYNGLNTDGVRGDFDLITSLEEGSVTVTYTSSNTDFIVIEEGVAKVTLPEAGTTDAGYVLVKLTATLTYNGATTTKEFNVKVNEKLGETTIADVLASTKIDTFEVKGTVTAINARGFTIYDGTGNILVYLNSTPSVELGDYVKVAGEISFYSEVPQFTSSADVEVLDEEAPAKAVFDYSNPEVWGLEELRSWVAAGAKVGPYVTVTGTLNVDGSYYNLFIDGDEHTLGSLSYPAADSGLDAYDGKVVSVTGILLYRSGSSHDYCNLIVTSVAEPELGEEAKAQAVKETLTLPESVTDTLALPSTGAYDAVITWESANTAVINIDENGVTVTQGDADVEVTLTATIKVGNTILTKEIIVTVKSADPYAPVLISSPVVGVEYKLMTVQGNVDNKNLYITGENSGNFLATTEDREAAADVVLVETEGGYHVSIVGETPAYLSIVVSGTYINAQVTAEATTVWTWNSEYNTLTTTIDGTEYYVGTYKTFETLSASKLSYAATSFVSHLYTVPEMPEYAINPAVETAYNLRVTQGNVDNKELYFTGTNSGNFLATSDNSAEAAVVKLVEVEGGYNVVVEGETPAYLNIVVSGTYINAQVTAEATTVWTWNSEYNTLTTTIDGTEYYVGTYKTFETLSASKLSYAATSFVSHLYLDVEEPVTPPTPEVEGLFANEGTMFGEEGKTHEEANAGKNILFWNDQNWCGSYVGVESSLEEGVYTYVVSTENAACSWGLQLFASVAEKVAGDEFTTTFVLNSTVAGKIRVNGEIIDIVVGDNEISTTKIYNGTLGEGSSQAAIIFGIDGDAANNQVVQNATYKISNFVITKKTVTEEPPVVVPPVEGEGIDLSYEFTSAVPEGLNYITNNSSYPNPAWYKDGGLKVNYVNMGFSTTAFEAQSSVDVTLVVNALNENTKSENPDVDAFTFYGLNAAGEVVATATLNTLVVGDNTVTLAGEGIVSVKVIMTDYHSNGTVCHNISVGGLKVVTTAE